MNTTLNEARELYKTIKKIKETRLFIEAHNDLVERVPELQDCCNYDFEHELRNRHIIALEEFNRIKTKELYGKD